MQRLGVLVTVATLALAAGPAPAQEPPPAGGATNGEAVILLHGLRRTPRSMRRMEHALGEAGYRVYALDYPSTGKPIERLAEEDLAPLVDRCLAAGPGRLHFVAHSMGNIVLRQYLAVHNLERAGRIVMLAPPNRGSEVVDKLGDYDLFNWMHGPAGGQLGTDSNSLPNTLPAPEAEVGIVAGTRSINWFLSSLIPGPDDGKVAVERTRLEGMDDFVAVPATHTFLMRDRHVIELTIRFLRTGRFEAENPAPPASTGTQGARHGGDVLGPRPAAAADD